MKMILQGHAELIELFAEWSGGAPKASALDAPGLSASLVSTVTKEVRVVCAVNEHYWDVRRHWELTVFAGNSDGSQDQERISLMQRVKKEKELILFYQKRKRKKDRTISLLHSGRFDFALSLGCKYRI